MLSRTESRSPEQAEVWVNLRAVKIWLDQPCSVASGSLLAMQNATLLQSDSGARGAHVLSLHAYRPTSPHNKTDLSAQVPKES